MAENSFLVNLQELVDETVELFLEVMGEDYGLGMMDVLPDQDKLRAEFERIANNVDLAEFAQQRDAFIQQYGDDQWQYQTKLALDRMGRV